MRILQRLALKIVKESKASFFLHCAQCFAYPSPFSILFPSSIFYSVLHNLLFSILNVFIPSSTILLFSLPNVFYSPPPPPPSPPSPHFYCFLSTTTTATFLFFSLLLLHHHHHHFLLISIVFPRKKQKAKIRPSHLSLALWAVFSRENNRNEEEVVVVVEEEEEGKQ